MKQRQLLELQSWFLASLVLSASVLVPAYASPRPQTHSTGYRRINDYDYFRLDFCAHHFGPKRKMFTFSRAHSHALTNATRRHEYFRGLSRLLPVPGVLVSFLELRFLVKMSLLALGGRPQPLKVKRDIFRYEN